MATNPLFRVMKGFLAMLFALALAITGNAIPVHAEVISLHTISPEGVGQSIGTVTALDSDDGLVIEANLNGLKPGEYGFHLHENGSCQPGLQQGVSVAGLGAGGHWDPDNTGKHLGPFGDGHRGDLSRLIVSPDGRTTEPVMAPRLNLSDLQGHALILHSGGDTYSDEPPLGGGGARMACGLPEALIQSA